MNLKLAYYIIFVSIILFFTSCLSNIITQLSKPDFSKNGGRYYETFLLELSSNHNSTIIYTTDEQDPTLNYGTIYKDPFLIEETTIIRAFAYKDGYTQSDVAHESYEFQLPKPRFNPLPGIYTYDLSLDIDVTPDSATLVYTTNNTEPEYDGISVTNGIKYTGAIDLTGDSTTDIKVKAFKENWDDSETLSGIFIIRL